MSKSSREEQLITASTADAQAQGRPRSLANLRQEPELAGFRAPQLGHAETEVEQHLIFLSHSGDFTTARLDQALRRAGHNPFFDIYNIPAAEHFEPHILQIAKECKLGVVVLSPGFLISKWPMRELHVMHTSPSKPKILPFFFKVEPNDLNLSSPSKLKIPEWRVKWQAFAENEPASISEWEVADTELSKIEGVVYKENMNIEDFIEHVVNTTCSVIPPPVRLTQEVLELEWFLSSDACRHLKTPVRYDISHLTGCTRLTQEVAKLFEEIPEAPLVKARAIGFHGIGGQGKTTICKLMVNHYASAYPGRCVLMEFPSNSCDKKEVVRQCNKALEQLTNNGQASRHVYVDDFDQCVQRMKDQVTRHTVFIVLDNVWEVCLEDAQRILDVRFSTGSRVLVTSRSKKVLLSLLKESRCVMALPGLNEEEARQFFIKSFIRDQATTQLPHFQLKEFDVDKVTGLYRFDSGYHPLTIGAVGASLGRTAADDQWLEAWEHMLDDFTGPHSAVEKAIKMNFESISERRRHLFLDVAFLYIPNCSDEDIDSDLIEEHLLVWLSVLYSGKMDKCAIKADLKQLAYDGLLEFDEDLKEVRVHDLYTDLAAREAAASGRFVDDRTGMNYAEAKRLHWQQGILTVPNFEELQFPKLELLIARTSKNEYRQWLQADMPHLRMLEIGVYNIDCNRELVEWGKMIELTWLSLHINESGFYIPQMLEDISELRNLLFLSIKVVKVFPKEYFYRSLCLTSFVNLQYLTLDNVNLEVISGLDSLINLKRIHLHKLTPLSKVGLFSSRSTQLEVVFVKGCRELREIQGLGNVRNLKELNITWASLHWQFGGDHTLCLNDSFVHLQYLTLNDAGKLKEISGLEGLINLKRIDLFGLPELLRVGHFSSRSTQLQFVKIHGCKNLREIQGLGDVPNLKQLKIEICPGLHAMLDGWSNGSLQHFILHDCSQAHLDWRRMTALEYLQLGFRDALEYLQLGFRLGTHAVELDLHHMSFNADWIRLGSTVEIHGLPKLTRLSISGHSTVEISFIHGQLPRLESLEISWCDQLHHIDFSKLTSLSNLEILTIESCNGLEEIDWSCLNNLTNLQKLSISRCTRLKMIKGKPNGINHTLRHLSIDNMFFYEEHMFCEVLEEVEGLELLKGLPDEEVTTLLQQLRLHKYVRGHQSR